MTSELLIPMEPVLVNEPFDDPDYLYQVKWDGVRMLARKTTDGVILWNRKGRLKTRLYPEVSREAEELNLPSDAILDGEMVSFGENGKPDFRRVLRRDLAANPNPRIEVCYVVFDFLEGTRVQRGSVYRVPLAERLQMLRNYVKQTPHIQVTDDFSAGTALFERMVQLEMEGIVAKRKDGFYHPGEKHPSWQKIKCWRHLQVKVVGVQLKDGRPSSLAVKEALTDDEPFRVGSGLAHSDWSKILTYAEVIPPDGRGTITLRPGIEARVRFLEWTHTGQLRAPVVEHLTYL
jgi:bifunctional non-homologous end joining protein LigD